MGLFMPTFGVFRLLGGFLNSPIFLGYGICVIATFLYRTDTVCIVEAPILYSTNTKIAQDSTFLRFKKKGVLILRGWPLKEQTKIILLVTNYCHA